MVSTLTGVDLALERIMTVYDGPSVDALTRRVRVLYNLAKDCKKGEIVELGTYHGYGAFAMAYGVMESFTPVRNYIFTIDDYSGRKGWAGESYIPEDFSIFMDKRRKLKLLSEIVFVRQNVMDAADNFDDEEVGLLYIDTGVTQELPGIFEAWKGKIAHSGIVAFRDTLTRSLKCDAIAAKAIASGQFFMIESPDNYFILIRRDDV